MNEISQFLVAHAGPVLFAVFFADQLGLPVPSAPWLLAAGALSAKGEMNAGFALGVSITACLIADSLWFCAGRFCGGRIWLLFSRLPRSAAFWLGLTMRLLGRHNLRGLVVAKFIPGLGMALPAVAGALDVSVGEFLLCDGLGALLYGSLYFIAGVVFHNQLQGLVATLNGAGFIVLGLALVLGSAYLGCKYVRAAGFSRRAASQNHKRREVGRHD